MIENSYYNFLANKCDWTLFLSDAIRFKTKGRAKMFLSEHEKKISDKTAKIQEHIFVGPESFGNNFLVKAED